MEQLRRTLPMRHTFFITIYTALIACIVVTPLPMTALCLPLIAYCSKRLYVQIMRDEIDAFNTVFELGTLLAAVTLFIAAHTALY